MHPPLSGQDNLHQLAGGDESRWSIKYPSELTKLIYGLPLQFETGLKYTVYVLVFKDFKTFTIRGQCSLSSKFTITCLHNRVINNNSVIPLTLSPSPVI
jgi:hypothetical protein